MKKIFLYSFVVVICLVAGCKKDNQANKIYLLSRQITDDRADGEPLDTANYTYDAHNRISTITDGTAPNSIKYAIAYDDQNRVTVAKKYDSGGNLIIEFDFFYRNDTTGYYFHGSPAVNIADTAYFTFNAKQQLTQITTLHSGIQTFGYDNNGNVSTTQAYNNDGSTSVDGQTSFAYDNKSNPFAGTSKNNYFFMYVVRIGNPSTLINNVVVRNADTYAYTYNKDGYPVQATITTIGETKIYVYYSYTTK